MATHPVGHQEERLDAFYRHLIEVKDGRVTVLEPDDNILVARDNVKNKKNNKKCRVNLFFVLRAFVQTYFFQKQKKQFLFKCF